MIQMVETKTTQLPNFDEAIRNLACANRHVSKPSANRASEIGGPNECLRRLTYARTHWDQRKQPDDYLMGIFQTGNEVEEILVRNLVDIGRHNGFRLIETQKTLEWPEYQIVGHCDGLIQVDSKTVAGMEIKSVGQRFESLKDIPSLMAWDIAAKWYGQAQIYMMLSNIPLWALLLVQKNNLYNTRTLWIELNYTYAEMIVKRAEQINAHIAADTLPDKINDPRKCLTCPFAHICMPDLDDFKNQRVFDDDDIAAALDRMDALQDAKFEYDKCERIAKKITEVLPEASEETYREPYMVTISGRRLCYVGSKRTSKPSTGGTAFFWTRQKKMED